MIRIGILGAADIAFNRFLPALRKVQGISCVGLARFSPDEDESRIQRFVERDGLAVYASFDDLIADPALDAVYVPTPPATHAHWATRVLRSGKHALIEKPIATSPQDLDALLALARETKRAIYENYMFAHHRQIRQVQTWLREGKIGDVRNMTAYFGFPLRQPNDFRYKKQLGGGARLDAAGYLTKLADLLLDQPRVVASRLNGLDGYDVDMYGSFMMVDRRGRNFLASYGMDNAYRCELDIWGSRGSLRTGRILTAPPAFRPRFDFRYQDREETLELEPDDHFQHSIERFLHILADEEAREAEYAYITRGNRNLQALLDQNVPLTYERT